MRFKAEKSLNGLLKSNDPEATVFCGILEDMKTLICFYSMNRSLSLVSKVLTQWAQASGASGHLY